MKSDTPKKGTSIMLPILDEILVVEITP